MKWIKLDPNIFSDFSAFCNIWMDLQGFVQWMKCWPASRGTCVSWLSNSGTRVCVLRKPLAGRPYVSTLRKCWWGEMFFVLLQLCVAGQQLASCPCSYHTGQVLDCPPPTAAASGKTVHSIFLSHWSQPRAIPMGDAFPTCILPLATSLCCCPTE